MVNWYVQLEANMQVLGELLASELTAFDDPKAVHKVMATLASGLLSSTQPVVKQTFRMFSALLKLAFWSQ